MTQRRSFFERDCLPKLTKLKRVDCIQTQWVLGLHGYFREKKELNKIYKSKEKFGKFGCRFILSRFLIAQSEFFFEDFYFCHIKD